jgi:hypothetical protein
MPVEFDRLTERDSDLAADTEERFKRGSAPAVKTEPLMAFLSSRRSGAGMPTKYFHKLQFLTSRVEHICRLVHSPESYLDTTVNYYKTFPSFSHYLGTRGSL